MSEIHKPHYVQNENNIFGRNRTEYNVQRKVREI